MEKSLYMEAPYTPHGPGPPFRSVPETLVQNQLVHNPDQALIIQLKRELETCVGKIKGYETLGHLLQESKQECARYKEANDEMAKRLDSLTRRFPTLESGDEMPGAACALSTIVLANQIAHGGVHDECLGDRETSSLTSKTSDDLRLQNSATPSSGVNLQKTDLHQRPLNLSDNLFPETNSRIGLNRADVTARTPPERSLERSLGVLSTSSASFVQISNSEAGSPPSTTSSSSKDFGDIISQKPEKSAVSCDTKGDGCISMDITSEISHITEHLKTVGNNSGASDQDLAADLIKAGVSVIKLQKQSKVQQVMLDQMASQITELKADNGAKQQTIVILQKDCDSLRNSMKRIEVARDQALQEARVKYKETAKDRDESTGEPSSVEWVEVETQQTRDKTTANMTETEISENETIVTAVPMVEVELRRRIEKLNATITELVSVNHSWDEHCRQIEAAHGQQIAALQSKQAEVNLRLEEYEKADQQRQIMFDNHLLDAKKQRDAEESAKEEALSKLHVEHQLRIDLEQRCIELSRKTAELEQRLLFLHNSRQVELTHNLQSAQLMTNPSSDKEKELSTQLLILQEQVSVFKEDFDQERRDRESTRATMEKLRKRLGETTEQLTSARSQLKHTTAELQTEKTNSERWRQRFIKLSNDVQSIQRQARPLDARVISEAPVLPSSSNRHSSSVLFIQPAGPLHNTPVRYPSWTCVCCTFSNPGQRSSCEMCGRTKSDLLIPQDSTSVTGGRSVAGLQDMYTAMPNKGRGMRHLETDFIDALPSNRQ